MKFNGNLPTDKPYPWPPEEYKPNPLLPRAPMNVFVISPYINGILDIRWDNPAMIPENTAFNLLGVNVYRSYNAEGGPYTLLNPTPLGAGVYRDITTNTLIPETVERFDPGHNPQAEWRFRTQLYPVVSGIFDPSKILNISNSPWLKLATKDDVVVSVDNGDGQGFLEVPILRIWPLLGEITLISTGILDPNTERIIPARLPRGPGDIKINYYVNTNRIDSRLNQRIFYKLTSVGKNKEGETVESELNQVMAVNLYQQEKTDYLWKEAIRRNRWILEQGGERVKVFIRKWNGEMCPRYSEQHEQGQYDCPVCYGTNYVGGYEGPFDLIIAPPDAEKNVELSEIGLRVNYMWETWTGPSPLLNKRDIVVRPTGERFSVGAINYQGQRGAIFQQNFQLSQLDSEDIVYKLLVDPLGITGPIPPNDGEGPTTPGAPVLASPQNPYNRNYPYEKGRTVTFEDIVY